MGQGPSCPVMTINSGEWLGKWHVAADGGAAAADEALQQRRRCEVAAFVEIAAAADQERGGAVVLQLRLTSALWRASAGD